jgi:hypothetical protein
MGGFPSHGVRARLVSRIFLHALVPGVLAAAALLLLEQTFPLVVASALFTLIAPGISALVAASYFRRAAKEDPLTVAIAFTTVAGLVELGLVNLSGGRFPFGFGFSLLLSFVATGLTGELLRRSSRLRSE